MLLFFFLICFYIIKHRVHLASILAALASPTTSAAFLIFLLGWEKKKSNGDPPLPACQRRFQPALLSVLMKSVYTSKLPAIHTPSGCFLQKHLICNQAVPRKTRLHLTNQLPLSFFFSKQCLSNLRIMERFDRSVGNLLEHQKGIIYVCCY